MTVVGLNYGFAGQMKLDEVTGGAPYGATTITGGDGSRQPSANELAGARYQGRVIAETANKLHVCFTRLVKFSEFVQALPSHLQCLTYRTLDVEP